MPLIDFPGLYFIISHDPDFLKGLCDRTFELSGGVLKNLNCSFDDYLKFHKEGVYGKKVSPQNQFVLKKRIQVRIMIKSFKENSKRNR